MTGQGYDYFPQGLQSYGNRIFTQNTHGEIINAHARDNFKNSNIVVISSVRRDTDVWDLANEFEVDLKGVYKNVASIELLSAKIPVTDEVAAVGSLYVYVWVNNRPLELITVGDTTKRSLTVNEKDMFSMDGAFAHIIVKNDPTIIYPYRQYRRIYRFMTPIEKINKIRIALRMYPADSKASAYDLVPMTLYDNAEFTFEINSQI